MNTHKTKKNRIKTDKRALWTQFNLDIKEEDITTNGGPNMIITYPIRFRFDFSKSDTLGYII